MTIQYSFSKELELLTWVYSPSDKKSLLGLNAVFVIWTDGNTCFPIGFRLMNIDDKNPALIWLWIF
ncbi:MAG: hypothetical protein IPM96_19100 [Ignavibacteria bacterium]|nr:hypothetical protein [Ignavibacteria bacterium]